MAFGLDCFGFFGLAVVVSFESDVFVSVVWAELTVMTPAAQRTANTLMDIFIMTPFFKKESLCYILEK